MGKDDRTCPSCGATHDSLHSKCYSCMCKDFLNGKCDSYGNYWNGKKTRKPKED